MFHRRLFIFIAAILGLFLLVSCGDDDPSDGGTGDDDDDAVAGDDDDDDDDDVADDDDDDDDDAAECDEGQKRCTQDGLVLEVCANGAWTVGEDCMAEAGRYCQDNACIDPWRYGNPAFDSCENDPNATTMTLLEKAQKYDRLAETLHVHPEHKRIHHATVEEGYTEDNAGWENVIDWHTGENDGLWTGLYIASQAFRYAATGEQQALDNLELMLDGMRMGMEITGVPGLFTREYINPGIAGMSCPSDPARYIPDPEKDDNKWVKVDTDGTILTYDGAQWVRSTHVVPVEFAGYCWLDNVSQDEYSGHMLALGVVWLLVDDPTVRDLAATLLQQVGLHLRENGMAIRDWDGRLVEHGRLWPLALTDWPGFNAILGLSYIKMAAVASGDGDLQDYYDDCLLQKSGPVDCLPHYLTPARSYRDWIWVHLLYFGHDACKSNWNNFAMMYLGIFTLIWYEHEWDFRQELAELFETSMYYHSGNTREMARQLNAGWTLLYSSMKNTGPGSTGQDIDRVNEAICALRQFPESKAIPTLEVGEAEYPIDMSCESRFDGRYLTVDPIPVYLRCPDTFTWWSNPYEHESCTANPQFIKQPADYLLPYWMARYFGYIDGDR